VRIVGDKERVFRLGGDEFRSFSELREPGHHRDLASTSLPLSPQLTQSRARVYHRSFGGIAVAPVDGTAKTIDPERRSCPLRLQVRRRGRFRFFATELLTAADDKRVLEEDLRDALQKASFRSPISRS
jgi:predicted signal transduction protein with EAL and GGDEF domain